MRPRLAALITAIGVSIIIQNVAMMFWGRNYLNFPQLAQPSVFQLGDARLSLLQIVIMLGSALIMAALLLLVHKTRLGMAMRATAQNREVAGLMGVNINTVTRNRGQCDRSARRSVRHWSVPSSAFWRPMASSVRWPGCAGGTTAEGRGQPVPGDQGHAGRLPPTGMPPTLAVEFGRKVLLLRTGRASASSTGHAWQAEAGR